MTGDTSGYDSSTESDSEDSSDGSVVVVDSIQLSYRVSAVLLLVLVVIGASAGAGFTYGLLYDTERGVASIGAATNYYTGGPCIDTDENWECEAGDISVSRANLTDFTNRSAVLVIPEGTGPVVNSSFDITAEGFKTEVRIGAQSGDVLISAVDARLQVVGATVNASSGVSLSATGGDVMVSGATFVAGSDGVELNSTADVQASNITVNTPGDFVVSGDTIALSGASVTTDYGKVSASANETLTLDGATIDTSGSVLLRGQSVSVTGLSVQTDSTVTLAATENGGGDLTADGIQVEAGGAVTVTATTNVSIENALMSATGQRNITAQTGGINAAGATITGDGDIQVTAADEIVLGGAIIESNGYGSITIEGGSLSANGATVVSSPTSKILRTTSGDADLAGITINGSASITVNASGALVVDGATIEAQNYGSVTLTGATVSAATAGGQNASISAPDDVTITAESGRLDATAASVTTNYGMITLEADGPLDAAAAMIKGTGYNAINLVSHGDMTLNQTAFSTQSEVQADLTVGSATLYVDGTSIGDSDGSLTYRPAGVTEVPERKDVVPA